MNSRILTYTLFALLLSFASSQATSLFSIQGVGVPVRYDNTRAVSLGGVDGPLADSLYLSLSNPAGWYNSGKTRFMVVGALELTGAESNSGLKANSDDFGFPSAAFSLPIYRGLGIGLSFHALTDYQFYTRRTTTIAPLPEDTAAYEITEVLQGAGGLSVASTNFGIRVNQNISIGGAVDYVFGKLDRELTTLSDDATLSTGGFKQHRVASGLSVRFGALAHMQDISLSATVDLPASIKVDQAIQVVGGDSLTIPATSLELPLAIGVGGAYRFGRYLAVSEGRFSLWGNTTQDIGASAYTNAWNIGVGIERQRSTAPLQPIYEQMTYRVGAHMNRMNVESGNNPIDGFGVAMGMGIPMRTHMGMLDLAMTLDWRGNAANNGAQERIFGIRLGVTSTESWFVRRKR